jgi:predicted 3-demethylubiquinone-9 3-methyltransferase (glyoxalase superfamily)
MPEPESTHRDLFVKEPAVQKLATCLWFDDQALDAAEFYVGVFPDSRILAVKRYPQDGPKPAGTVLTVSFVLNGCEYVALNGGPHFQFSPAISLVAYCDNQAELDHLWSSLLAGGQASQCGWLTDRYGLSWQIVPRMLIDLLNSPDAAASQRLFNAMMHCVKLDFEPLQRAYDGR